MPPSLPAEKVVKEGGASQKFLYAQREKEEQIALK